MAESRILHDWVQLGICRFPRKISTAYNDNNLCWKIGKLFWPKLIPKISTISHPNSWCSEVPFQTNNAPNLYRKCYYIIAMPTLHDGWVSLESHSVFMAVLHTAPPPLPALNLNSSKLRWASSKQNHFDIITSKCWPDRHLCVGQVFSFLTYLT